MKKVIWRFDSLVCYHLAYLTNCNKNYKIITGHLNELHELSLENIHYVMTI